MIIEAVIFDLDGLMIDSEPLQLKAMNIALVDFGIQLSESKWKPMVGHKTKENFLQIINDYKINADLLILIERKNNAYRQIIRKHVPPMPGLHEAINNIKKTSWKLAIASSSVKDDINIILKNLNLENSFDIVVSGDQVNRGKPDPEIFLKTASKLKTSPNKCLVLEDTIYGVNAAKSAGMFCIAIPNKYTATNDFSNADLVLESLIEITPEILKKYQ